MRKFLLAVAACVVIGLVAASVLTIIMDRDAQAQITGQRSVPLGYQQLTSLATSTALTVPLGATTAVIVAEAQAIRYRDDGTDPSATVGQPSAVAAVIVYTGTLSAVRIIEQTSGAKVNVLYYR